MRTLRSEHATAGNQLLRVRSSRCTEADAARQGHDRAAASRGAVRRRRRSVLTAAARSAAGGSCRGLTGVVRAKVNFIRPCALRSTSPGSKSQMTNNRSLMLWTTLQVDPPHETARLTEYPSLFLRLQTSSLRWLCFAHFRDRRPRSKVWCMSGYSNFKSCSHCGYRLCMSSCSLYQKSDCIFILTASR